MKINTITHRIYGSIIFFFFCQNLCGQNPIKIIQSNTLDQLIIHDTIFQKFSGDVIVEYEDFQIICDNILIDEYKESVRGWGNAKIANDTVTCKTDSITIKQFQKLILLHNNTVINTNQMNIYSDQVQYNYETNTLKYFKGGIVKTKDYKISSENFIHKIENDISQFNNLVELETDQHNIITEKMQYMNETIDFFGETSIEHSNYLIHCNKGLYRKGDIFKIYNQQTIDSYDRIIKSDTLLIDIKKNCNYFQNNVEIMIDPTTYILATHVKQNDQYSYIHDDCYIKLFNELDSTIIIGDTIRINDQEKKIDIINNVIIQGEDLEGSCQNMQFTNNYKDIYMYDNPVLWINETQITGDDIELYVIENNLDSIYIPKNPFIISASDSLKYYNQIIGKTLYGKFRNNQIEYIMLEGNSKMKYFEQNKEEISIVGLNNIEAGKIKVLFEAKNTQKVSCTNQIESDYIELDRDQTKEKNKKLLYFAGFELINRPFSQNK